MPPSTRFIDPEQRAHQRSLDIEVVGALAARQAVERVLAGEQPPALPGMEGPGGASLQPPPDIGGAAMAAMSGGAGPAGGVGAPGAPLGGGLPPPDPGLAAAAGLGGVAPPIAPGPAAAAPMPMPAPPPPQMAYGGYVGPQTQQVPRFQTGGEMPMPMVGGPSEPPPLPPPDPGFEGTPAGDVALSEPTVGKAMEPEELSSGVISADKLLTILARHLSGEDQSIEEYRQGMAPGDGETPEGIDADPEVADFLARMQTEPPEPPAAFQSWLDRTDPGSTNPFGADILDMYRRQPDMTPLLWGLVLEESQDPEGELPPELASMARGRGSGGPAPVASDTPETELPTDVPLEPPV